MSCDTFFGIAATAVFTVLVVLLTPGLTVMTDRMIRLKELRRRLHRALDECEETIKFWIRSSDTLSWQKSRSRIKELWFELEGIKNESLLIGGGCTLLSEMRGGHFTLSGPPAILYTILENTRDAARSPEKQRQSIAGQLEPFRVQSLKAKTYIDNLEHVPEFRSFLLKEILIVYGGVWSVVCGVLRRPFQN